MRSKLVFVLDVAHPRMLHRSDCKHRGAGGNTSAMREATRLELETLGDCDDCKRREAKEGFAYLRAQRSAA
jgi:hypothetical protein